MENIYNQILEKIIVNIDKPEFKKKFNQCIVDPLIHDIYLKTHNYFITIISLYGITIILLLIIIININYNKYK